MNTEQTPTPETITDAQARHIVRVTGFVLLSIGVLLVALSLADVVGGFIMWLVTYIGFLGVGGGFVLGTNAKKNPKDS